MAANADVIARFEHVTEHWRKVAQHRMLSLDPATAAEGRAMIALLTPFVAWANNEMAGHELRPALMAFAESVGLILALMGGLAATNEDPGRWLELASKLILAHAQSKYNECACFQGAH